MAGFGKAGHIFHCQNFVPCSIRPTEACYHYIIHHRMSVERYQALAKVADETDTADLPKTKNLMYILVIMLIQNSHNLAMLAPINSIYH